MGYIDGQFLCKKAKTLHNLGEAFLVLFIMLVIAFVVCVIMLIREIEVDAIFFIVFGSSAFSCITIWAFALAVADIAESTFRMAHK